MTQNKKHRLLAEQYGNDVLALQEKLKELEKTKVRELEKTKVRELEKTKVRELEKTKVRELEKTKRTAEKALQEERGQLRIKVETIEHLEGKVTALEANCASLQEANALERKNSGDIHGILRTQQEQFQRLKALMDAKIASLEQEKIQRLEDYEQIKRQLLKLEEERQRRSREQDETRQLRQQQKQLRRLFEALKKGTSEELEDLLEEFLPRDASQDTFLSNGEIGSISEASLGTSRGTHDENDNSECSLHAGLLMQNVVALVRQKVRASAEKEELLNRLESLMPLSVAAGSDEGDGRTIVERLSGELASKKQLEEVLTDWLGANGDFSGIVERLKERIQAEEELREFLDEKPETLFTTVVNDARKAVISKENQLREALQELAEVRAWTSEQDALLKQIGMVLEVENIQDVVEVKKIADTLRNTQWRLKDAEETVGRMARELRERMIQLEAAEMDSREKEQLLVRAREEVTEKVGRIGDLEGQLKAKDVLVLSSNQRVTEWELAVRGLEKQVAEQRLAKETSEREAEALREKVEYAESLKGQLEQEVLEGKAKIEEEMMKIQRLENDLNAKEEEVGFLVAAQSKAEEDLKEIREELRQVQEQLEGERSAKEHLKLEWSGELENEKAEKRRLLTEFEGRINVITTECEKRVNKIETELEDWKGNFRECESHLNEASQENCDLRKKISVMDGSIEKLKDTQEKLEAENEKLRGELKDVCLQDSRLRRSLEGEVEDLKKSVDDLQKKKAQLEAKNQVLAAEVDGLRKSHAEAEKSLSVLDGRFRTLESLHASLCEDKTCFEQSILELLSAVSAEMGEKFLQQVKREDQDFRLCAVSQFLKDFLMKDLKAVQSALGMAEGEFRVEDLWGVVEELKRRGEERDELDRELQKVKEERGREARLMEAVEEQMEKATKELQLMEEERKKQEEAWREELESYKRRLSPEMSLSVGMSHALVVDLLRYFRISTTVLPAAPCQPPDPADGGDKECHALGRGGVFGRRESPDGGEIESPRSEVPVSLSSGLTPPVEVDPLPPPAAPVASGREEEEDAKDIGSEDADGMEDLELTFQRIQAQVRRATSVLLAQGGHDPASQGPVPPDPYSLAVDLSWQPPLAEADEGAREGFPSASSLLVQRIKEADVNLLNDRLEVLEEELLRAKQAKADVTGQLQAARSEIRGLHQGLQDKEREVWDLQEKVAGLVRDQDGLSRNSAVSLYSSPRASLPHCSSSVSLVSARTTGGQEMEVCFTSLPPQERCDPVDEVETQDLDPEEMDERQRNTNELIQKARALLDSSNDEFGSFDDFSREDLISRLQIYENLFAEAQLHLNEKKKTIDELGEQLHSASRHLSSREELLSQNAREWDLERESHAQEVTSLQNRVTEVEKSKEKMQNFLKEEIPSASTSPCPSSRGLRYWSKYPHHLSMVENLELQLRDLHSELLAERKRNCSAAKELSKALRMNSELRDTMVALEGQLKEARQRERAFQQEKDQLKEELQRLSVAHDELKQDWELLHAALMSSSHPSASSSASLLRDEEFEEDVASGDGADMSLMQEIRRVNRQSSPGSQDDDESTLEGGDNSADTTVPADSAASRPSSARDGSSPALPHPNGPTDDHGIDAIQKVGARDRRPPKESVFEGTDKSPCSSFAQSKEFAMERAIWSAELTSARQKICVLKGALDEQKMRKDDSEELRKELKLLKRELHQARTELMAREKQLRGNEYRLAESRVLVTQRSQPEHLADAEQRASSDDQGSQSSPLRSSEDNAASVSSENSRKCGGFDSSSIPSESDTSLLGPKETSTPRGARRTKASQSQRKRRDKVASPGESGGQVSDGSLFAAEEVLRRRLSFAASDADRDLQFTQDPGSSSRHRIVPRVLDPKSVFLTDEESHKCPPEEDLEFLTPDSFDEVHHGSQTLSAGFRRQRESAEPGESVPNHIEAGNEDFRFLDDPRPFRLPTQESVELRNRIRNLEEENQELKRIIEVRGLD
ncbi:unnamed protein product [Cyprideis torosa]|uniref:Uncharacterized protein n=1 Tax=Cyprideis torosa TaxID=163714 RepID=A0A7R8W6S0_9CRUS|nr:unnamed protein product [Cyprideis torosa]CAG0886845.1 unnamed protein product [Cyprideis torosa]